MGDSCTVAASRTGPTMFDKVDIPFLLAAFLSLLVSVALWFLVNHDYGVFVGLWVPSILAFWVGVRVRLLGRLDK